MQIINQQNSEMCAKVNVKLRLDELICQFIGSKQRIKSRKNTNVKYILRPSNLNCEKKTIHCNFEKCSV